MILRKFFRFTVLFGKSGSPGQCRLLPPAFPKAACPLSTYFDRHDVLHVGIPLGSPPLFDIAEHTHAACRKYADTA